MILAPVARERIAEPRARPSGCRFDSPDARRSAPAFGRIATVQRGHRAAIGARLLERGYWILSVPGPCALGTAT